jgi:preprotein translocase subunit YajC
LPNGSPRIDLSALKLETMSFAGIFAFLIFAQGTPSGTVPDPRANTLQFIGPLLFMVVIMYVIIFRPQQKKAKEHAELLKVLKSGDKVVTSSGILGVVISVKDKSVTVRSGDTKLEILKSAVSEVTERGGAAAA